MHVQGVGLVPGRVRQQREGLATRLVLQRPHVQLQPRPAACPRSDRCTRSVTVRHAPQHRISLHLYSQVDLKPLDMDAVSLLSNEFTAERKWFCWNHYLLLACLLTVE